MEGRSGVANVEIKRDQFLQRPYIEVKGAV